MKGGGNGEEQNPSVPGGGGESPSASRGSCPSPASHLCFFQQPNRLKFQAAPAKRCPRLPKTDLNSFSAHSSVFASRKLPSGHKEELSFGGGSAGSVPAPTGTSKVSLLLGTKYLPPYPTSPTPQSITQARKDPELGTHLAREGRRLCGRPPAVFHFPPAPLRSSGEDSEKGFGKGRITLIASSPNDPGSRFSQCLV